MGLDNYAQRKGEKLTEDDYKAFKDADINLCGGMMSSNGQGSFRGKVYAGLVQNVTGVSLYEDHIPYDIVAEMWDDIANAITDLTELEKFFRVCKDRGIGIGSWY